MLRVVTLIALFAFGASHSARAEDDCAYQPKLAATSTQLKRGVNLSRWWEDDRHQTPSVDDFENLHQLGVDFVRVPLSPQYLMQANVDEQQATLKELRCDIISILNNKLNIVVDLHAWGDFQNDLSQDPNLASAKLENLWRHMQPVLADLPAEHIYLGLYNEPHIDTATWWDIQKMLVQSLRMHFPRNTFVVTAGPDGGPWDLARMKPYADKNIIYDFHFYQPMIFTHHGADWLSNFKPEDKTTPIPYPVKPDTEVGEGDLTSYVAEGWNREHIAGFIQKIAKWAKHAGNVRIACFEFGVYRPYVDEQSRANWLRDVRELLERANIPWALWEYRGSFGLLDETGSPDEEIIKALGLNQSPSP